MRNGRPQAAPAKSGIIVKKAKTGEERNATKPVFIFLNLAIKTTPYKNCIQLRKA
jgi:hypothetical protein